MARSHAALVLAAALLLVGSCSAVKVDKCEPSSEGCYPSKAYLIALRPTAGAGVAPPLVLSLWARQSLCTAAQSEDACMSADDGSSCYWDAQQMVCFSGLKAPEAVACPGSWVSDFVYCDTQTDRGCMASRRCVFGQLGNETLCWARVASVADPPFPDWGTYQRITFTDESKLGNCPAAQEYRKFHARCKGAKDPNVCETDTACMWNRFVGCSLRARANAAWVTGNNAKIAAAYAFCNGIKSPDDCLDAGQVEFTPAVAATLVKG